MQYGDALSDLAEPGRLRIFIHDIRQYIATGLLLYDDAGLTEVELRDRLRTGDRLFHQLSALVDREVTEDGDPRTTAVDVPELVEECVSIFRHGHPALDVRTAGTGHPACLVERGGLHRALTNVLENAARAAGEHGHVTVRTWGNDADVCLEISDDGKGFGQMSHGTGHGMQTVDKVLRAAQGRLEIRSGPEAGTQVRFVLPRVESVETR